MTFRPFNVSIPHIFYAVLGGFVVLFGMFSLLIREKLYIGEAPLAFVFGVIMGPYGANVIDPRSWGGGNEETVNQVTLEVTRVILAVGVFAIGVELPKAYMAKHWKSLFFLIAPVMTWGWIVSAGLIFALIPGLNFLSSLAVAACLTPTDPILAAAVVGGKYADKHVPAHLRHLLAAESGCNDGAAFPFLYIALYLSIEASDRHAVQDWFLITWLYEVVFGIVFGAIIGFAFRHLMKFCERKDLIDRQSYVAQYVSLAMFTIGVTTMLGSDDLLAAFACGTAFAWDGFFNRQTEQAVFSSVIDLLFNIAAFIFIGAWMPFSAFSNAELTLSVWRLIVIAILVLLLRRLPIILALYRWIPDVKTFREAVFSGHFGPIGVGAVFISTLATEALPKPENPSEDQVELLAATIQPIVAFMVLCSITIHGLSIPFFTFGRRVHSVSRTWSRHQSMDPSGPEWATHTRRVARPEDIVINRDSAMERGEVLGEEEKQPSPVDTTAEKEEEMIPSSSSSSSPLKDHREFGVGDPNASTEGRPDSPPDGEDLEQEWREGPDIVRETRTGPGEEVEVEVVHNCVPDEERGVMRMEESARRAGERFRRSISRERRQLGAKAEEVIGGRGAQSGDDDRQAGPSSGGGHLLPQAPLEATSALDDEDEDEGWTSDRSEPSRQHHPSSQQSHDHDHDTNAADIAAEADASARRRSKSPRHKQIIKPSHHMSHRRRNSIRRGLLGRTAPFRPADPAPTVEAVAGIEEGDERERGRPLSVVGLGPSGSQTPPLTHRRVDSLRDTLSRSSSPARSVRSIRFADDSSSVSSAVRVDEKDSPTSPMKVAFDLPPDSKT